MGYNYSKLRGKIVEKFKTQSNFSAAMKMSERSLSLKLNCKRPFNQRDIFTACKLLDIQDIEISEYFFQPEVQKVEQ